MINLFKKIKQYKRSNLYEFLPYLDVYAAHTDSRVEEDPHTAISGQWEEIGTLQFDYLVKNGLESHHRLLDIGCGSLRGGRHFIRYLDAERYTGIDISPKALAYAQELVASEGLDDKRPRLLLNEEKTLLFSQFDGETFDFLLAQSVLTHLPSETIEECFAHLGCIMHDGSVFFFTFREGKVLERNGPKDFEYPASWFEDLASAHGFSFELRDDYAHPRGQRMMLLRNRGQLHQIC